MSENWANGVRRVCFVPEATQIVGVCAGTLARWRQEGRGPKFRRLGGRKNGRIIYDYDALQKFLNSPAFGSIAEERDARRNEETGVGEGGE